MKTKYVIKYWSSFMITLIAALIFAASVYLNEHPIILHKETIVEVEVEADYNTIETESWKAQLTEHRSNYYLIISGEEAYQLTLQLMLEDYSLYIRELENNYVKLVFLYDSKTMEVMARLRELKTQQ